MLIKELSVRFHVGIDVSILTLDIFILECNIHKKVSNNPRGFNDLLQMIEKNPCFSGTCCILLRTYRSVFPFTRVVS